MIVTAKKYKELEDKLVLKEQEFENKLSEQERLFETELDSIKRTYQLEIDELELDKKYLRHELDFAKANEESLNKMTGSLSKKLISYEAFPEKKFNIDKAIDVLTTKLTPKALATFLHKLVEALGESHVASLNNYVLRRLSSGSKKE